MKTLVIHCEQCSFKFKSFYTLKKHCIVKHPNVDIDTLCPRFPDLQPTKSLPLCAQIKNAEELERYKMWLAGLVERMNSAYHPQLPGKWVRVDSPQVPKHFFEHLLHRVGTQVNAIQERPHRQLPYSAKTNKFSYKIFHLEDLLYALHEQSLVPFKHALMFSGNNICQNDIMEKGELSAQRLIELATKKAAIPQQLRKRVTSKSKIIVGFGEGRSTREVEFIWWPDIFSVTNNGHLVIRLFISKCDF